MKINKKLTFISLGIFLILFSIVFVKAIPPVIQASTLYGLEIKYPAQTVIKQGMPYHFNFHVYNISTGNSINSSTICFFHLYNNSGNHILELEKNFTNHLFDYEFYISGGNFSYSGDYNYLIQCSSTGNGGFADVPIEVTPNGDVLNTGKSILFGIFMFFFLGLLVFSFSGFFKSNGAWQIAYICLSYLCLFAIFFLSWDFSSNYLFYSPVLASIFWILWLVLAFGFLPFIIVISVYIIGKGVKDNLYKEFISQGHSPEEAREMAKRGKR